MIASGTMLGPYKIVAPIGAGGMGEVYRAHDTRLGRDIAIKVLSPQLAATPEAHARFEREARTISQLNHPHICTLFDIGHQGDTDYLVMELLEGETLAHRLEKGPLPIAEVLSLGMQIADALDIAHRHGIIHRDLKPGNVMLTSSGAKLMDFGLARDARAVGGPGLTPGSGALDESPTLTSPLTADGALVGTFQYMAPEQLEGKDADARTDLWALGCVLYEMATGKRPFQGTSQASLIAAIMEHEPPSMTERQPLTPPALEHVVRRCLEKDPAERWEGVRDVMHELQWTVTAGSQAHLPVLVAAQRRREWLTRASVVAATAITLLAVVTIYVMRRSPAPELARLTINPPAGWTIEAYGPLAAVSPDGRQVVISARDSGGTQRLWIRSMDSFAEQALAGTENASFPFWSPDGRYVAFFAGNNLWKIAAAGGPPEKICVAPDGRGGSWSKGGVIVFAPQGIGPIARVPCDGGEVVVVARPDSTRGEAALRFPCFLPDGRHFLYVGLPARHGQFEVHVGDLESKETRHVMTAESAPVYAEPGYLLFERERRLVAQRFDESRMCPTGKVIVLEDAPPPPSNYGASILCPPSRNALVMVRGKTPDTQLAWLDRAGRRTGTVPLSPGRYEWPSLSPDGRWAAVTKVYSANRGDIWMVDLQRSLSVPGTFDSSATSGGAWAPDGSRFAYQANPSGTYDIYQVLAGGRGRPEPLVQSEAMFEMPEAYSPDGRYFVFSTYGPTQWDLWLMPLDGQRTPVPYLRTPFSESMADISPDGRWLAYSSDENGRLEIYVRSFPEPGERHQISTAGGTAGRWSRDGRQLLIWTGGEAGNPAGSVLSVEVETAPSFRVGTSRQLFVPPPEVVGMAVTRDLEHWLAAVQTEGKAPLSITVILNWQEALRR